MLSSVLLLASAQDGGSWCHGGPVAYSLSWMYLFSNAFSRSARGFPLEESILIVFVRREVVCQLSAFAATFEFLVLARSVSEREETVR